MSAVATVNRAQPYLQVGSHGAVAQKGRIQLNDKVSVTAEELARIMGVNEKWPHPGRADPWVLVHDAIRNDMRCLVEALETMLTQLKGGSALQAWQVSNLQAWLPMHCAFVHHHHDNEEKILFPWINTRTNLGERMAADHAALLSLIDKMAKLTKNLKVSGKAEADLAAIQEIKGVVDELRPLMLEHLQEEEDRGLPLMRMYFSHEELKPIENKIKKHMTPMSMGHLLNHLPIKEKKDFMTAVQIPGLIQTLLLLPVCKKYTKVHHRLIAELQAGEQTPLKKGCFSA